MPSHLPTDISAEFYIDGAWYETYAGYDLAARCRGRDALRITRGLVDQQSAVSPTQGIFTLNNRDGLFTDGNPNSVLYGKLGLNTRARLGVKTGGTWDEYIRVPDFNTFGDNNDSGWVETADKASLDITGDIDIRVEFTPRYTRGRGIVLASKWFLTGNQRSWVLDYRSDGQLRLTTSPDGTLGASLSNFSGVTLGENVGRIAIRVTLDVNDGAGNRVYRWYTAPSISSTWTLVSSGTIAGTTSIFSGTGLLQVGGGNGGVGVFTGTQPLRGKIHAFELYNGIAGTLVADMKPAGKGLDTTTWADSCASPNTWTVNGLYARMASDRIRVTGELSSLPEDWDLTGTDRFVITTLTGILKRYQSNSSPLRGAIYRNYRNYAGLTGYWTMEDSAGATQAASALTNGQAGAISTCTFGPTTGLDGSTGAITMTSAPNVSKIILRSNTVTNTGATSFLFYFRLAALPATDTVLATLLTSGTATRWTIAVSNIGFAFTAYDMHGIVIDTGSALFGTGASPLDQWIGMQLVLTQEGGNVRWRTSWHAVGTSIFYSHFSGGDTYAGTMNQFKNVTFDTPDAAFAGAQIAHVMTASIALDLVSSRFQQASIAYSGETFIRRAIRLAEEEDVYFEWLGDPDDSAIVGPQAADTLFNVLAAGAKVDGGILGEPRDKVGYRYASQTFLTNRRGVILDYDDAVLSAVPRPTNDDRYTVNDFTASRPGGSDARYVADDNRRKNVREPDDATSPGVGRYERADAYGVATDSQLDAMAQRQVALGTWDERRIPNLAVGLHRSEVFNASSGTLLADVIGTDVGDNATLTGLSSAPMPPEDVNMLVFGYTEVIDGFTWEWTANTVPAGPYQVPLFSGLFANTEPRLDASGNTKVHCVKGSGVITTSATSITWRTPSDEPAWADSTSYPSEFNFDIKITGERMTASAITASTHNGALITGTFESGVSEWEAVSCTFTQSSTFAHAGTFSGLMTVTGTPTQSYALTTLNNSPRVDEGDVITVAIWVRSTALLSDVRVVAGWRTASGSYLSISDSGAAALASGSWVQRTLTATAPAGVVHCTYGATIAGSPAAGTLLYVDDATFSNASANYQTATVTRSVNGISKTHDDGEQVWLMFPAFNGMGE